MPITCPSFWGVGPNIVRLTTGVANSIPSARSSACENFCFLGVASGVLERFGGDCLKSLEIRRFGVAVAGC
jgi:hypothetical protein